MLFEESLRPLFNKVDAPFPSNYRGLPKVALATKNSPIGSVPLKNPALVFYILLVGIYYSLLSLRSQ